MQSNRNYKTLIEEINQAQIINDINTALKRHLMPVNYIMLLFKKKHHHSNSIELRKILLQDLSYSQLKEEEKYTAVNNTISAMYNKYNEIVKSADEVHRHFAKNFSKTNKRNKPSYNAK